MIGTFFASAVSKDGESPIQWRQRCCAETRFWQILFFSRQASSPARLGRFEILGWFCNVRRRGLKENWRTRDEYLTAFEKTPSTDLTGRAVTDAKNYVACTIGAQLRTHQIWDEGPPIEVEVDRAITEFSKWRDEAEQARTAKARSSNQEGYVAEHQPRP
jgi:hypothetical protein